MRCIVQFSVNFMTFGKDHACYKTKHVKYEINKKKVILRINVISLQKCTQLLPVTSSIIFASYREVANMAELGRRERLSYLYYPGQNLAEFHSCTRLTVFCDGKPYFIIQTSSKASQSGESIYDVFSHKQDNIHIDLFVIYWTFISQQSWK